MTKTKGRKWRLFHATDFQSLMHPNFTINKIFGIFPYRIKASSFEMSKLRYILWTIIVCVIFIYKLIILYDLNLSGKIRINIHIIISSNFSILYVFLLTVISYTLSECIYFRLYQIFLQDCPSNHIRNYPN